MLAQAELRSYLQLAFTPYLGIVSFLRLINHWQHPKRILDMSFSAVRPWLDKPNQVQPYWNSSQILTTMVEPALIWLNEGKNNCHILTLFDDDYPLSLSEIHHPPPVLFLKGNLHLLTLKKIAIVGSRQATPQGLAIAKQTAENLSTQNFCIVSGMASGIDGAAHEGALKQSGGTIAVLGTGIDIVYPKHHLNLAHHIAEKGLLISEFPLGTRANAANFPIRNRIIAGLSLATVIVEASLHSGSLITARLAMEQGKDVMAFPGSIFSPQAKGCHHLIKQGAKLVESSEEISEDYRSQNQALLSPILKDPPTPTSRLTQDSHAQKIISLLSNQLLHPDEICLQLKLENEQVQSILLALELDGFIKRNMDGRYQSVSAYN